MRMREYRATIMDSMSTTQHIEGREQLVPLIVDKLAKIGFVAVDAMIHVSHYGFDERIDWDEHIIVVEGFGVFGFTDEPCPAIAEKIGLAIPKGNGESARQLAGDEVESAYGVNN
jgi:hypothetical protein